MNKEQFFQTYVATFLANWATQHAYAKGIAIDSNRGFYSKPPIEEALRQAKIAWDSYISHEYAKDFKYRY